MRTPIVNDDCVTGITQAVALRPPAKLNISLVVFGRRPDGFHDLHSVMATINLHDDLHLRFSDQQGIHLHCSGLPSPQTPENLTWRAAEILAQHAQIEPALDIFLQKRIPSGAGLGGASSDAAACLLGLNRLWSLNYSIEELAPLAAQLGSDVPFFLQGPAALCTGRGEIIRELPHRCRRHILLIVPEIHTPTAQVYKNYTYDEANSQEDLHLARYFLRRGDLDGLLIQNINSLRETTLSLFSPLEDLRSRLTECGITPVHMTGSGSTLFATSESREEIAHWAREIKNCNLAQPLEAAFMDQAELFLEEHHGDN